MLVRLASGLQEGGDVDVLAPPGRSVNHADAEDDDSAWMSPDVPMRGNGHRRNQACSEVILQGHWIAFLPLRFSPCPMARHMPVALLRSRCIPS